MVKTLGTIGYFDKIVGFINVRKTYFTDTKKSPSNEVEFVG